MEHETGLRGTVGRRDGPHDTGPAKITALFFVGRWRRRAPGDRTPAGALARPAAVVFVAVRACCGRTGAVAVRLSFVRAVRIVSDRIRVLARVVAGRSPCMARVVLAR